MQKLTLAEKFEKFDYENPGVYDLFVRFANDVIRTGRQKISAALIVERIRWEVNIMTVSDDVFKLSNNHTAFYARKFMTDFPKHAGIFNIREQKV